MVQQVINGLIAGVIGAVAYVAVKAMVSTNIYGYQGGEAYGTADAAGNITAGELMIHDILPLAIAIMVIAGLFLGLTRVRSA